MYNLAALIFNNERLFFLILHFKNKITIKLFLINYKRLLQFINCIS